MTETEYWQGYNILLNEVEAVVQAFHAYITVNNLAREDRGVYEKLNKAASFWNLCIFSLQTTFFIVLSRIFDTARDAHSVHKLLRDAIEHPEFFSKAALCARKRFESRITGPNPPWLDECLGSLVREVSKDDLKLLRKELAPHFNKFKAVYHPIRTKIFAHTLLTDERLVSSLFSKTQIRDVDEILHSLYKLIDGLWEIWHNGRNPTWNSENDRYRRRIDEIKESTQKLMNQLS
jgi:AbiU2